MPSAARGLPTMAALISRLPSALSASPNALRGERVSGATRGADLGSGPAKNQPGPVHGRSDFGEELLHGVALGDLHAHGAAGAAHTHQLGFGGVRGRAGK